MSTHSLKHTRAIVQPVTERALIDELATVAAHLARAVQNAGTRVIEF